MARKSDWTARVVIDRAAVQKVFRSRDGDVNKMMRRFANDARTEARNLADQRLTQHTGRYRRSIKARVVAPTRVELEADVPYALVIEKGSRRHLIVPRRARVLAFEVNGRMVFAMRVHHPGTKAQNILRDAVKEAGRKIRKST